MNFGLVGAGGYIAPRHVKAIKDLGGNLMVASDVHDSVGYLDSFFPNVLFFNQPDEFERFLASTEVQHLDFLTVCTPNHLHDLHIRQGLKAGLDVICEKPVVLYPETLDILEMEQNISGKSVFPILQLRLHDALKGLANIQETSAHKEVELTYITPRGRWFDVSWKGAKEASGGLCTNIGIHFFDLFHSVFGHATEIRLHLNESRRVGGTLEFANTTVRWFLSVERDDLLMVNREDRRSMSPFRHLVVDGKPFDFSLGFDDLHALSYKKIIEGSGFSLRDTRPSIETVSSLRKMSLSELDERAHPMVYQILGNPGK